MPQRGGKASVAIRSRGGWVLRKRHVAASPQVSAGQHTSRVVYVVRVRNVESGEFATLVRTGRIAARLSQQDLADAIGVSRWAVLRWEGNKQKPENAEVVAKLAEVIRVDYDVLMRAVGLALAGPGTAPEPDPRLRGLNPNSPQVRHIMSMEDEVDAETLEYMLNRQREIDALRARQDIAEIELIRKRERERQPPPAPGKGGRRKAS